uniref:Cytochrome c biogenesis protein CcsB n=1 Tax=Apoglossum ruscifolium TaxID=167976 RepID=A0A4D6WLH0_9FLOR|nr:cytochrome c biogenesis protein ccs1 [Apoglossum ruscifolium]
MQLLNRKNIVWNFLKKLANLNFSISILLLISFCIMLGSIIEQDQSILYYKTFYSIDNKNIFFIDWRPILFFGLDHIYQTWWFILILFTFGASLITCTFSIQLPGLKNARRWKFFNPVQKINVENNIYDSINYLKNSSINIIFSLVYYNFYVFHKKNYIYSYKGLIGRIAPIFVHISIIIILIGSIFSSFFGFMAQEMVPKNEIFHIKNIIRSGSYSHLNTNFICRVDNFFIDYNFDNSIKQFFSKLSLFNNRGELILSKLISVNSPLKFSNFTFYQTDWNINSLRFNISANSKLIIQKALVKININNKPCWLCKFGIDNNKEIYFIIFSINDKILVSNSNGVIINSILKNESFYLNNTLISIQDIILDTGLQIKTDPGVNIIYFGFFILIITTMISYISYSQIWITIMSNILNFSGSTNRAIFLFEEDIAKINKIYYRFTFINLNSNNLNTLIKILKS